MTATIAAEASTVTSGTYAPAIAGPEVSAATLARFEALFIGYYTRIRAALYVRVANWDLADDLTQRMFTYLWEQTHADAVDLTSITTPFTWLMRRARWTLSHHYASLSARAETTVPADHLAGLADHACHPVDQATTRITVGQLLLQLPPGPRRALALHLLEGLPIPDVAAITGDSPHTVQTLIGDGLTRLRASLDVTSAQLAATTAANRRHLTRTLTRLADPPATYADVVRHALLTAITAGTYPPGTLLPRPAELSRRHIPPPPPPAARTTSVVSRRLKELAREGLLTSTRRGYQIPADIAARLHNLPPAHISARQALARELLAGTWPPGTVLPNANTLSRRWGCTQQTATQALTRLADLGVLTPTCPGRYQVNALSAPPPQETAR